MQTKGKNAEHTSSGTNAAKPVRNWKSWRIQKLTPTRGRVRVMEAFASKTVLKPVIAAVGTVYKNARIVIVLPGGAIRKDVPRPANAIKGYVHRQDAALVNAKVGSVIRRAVTAKVVREDGVQRVLVGLVKERESRLFVMQNSSKQTKHCAKHWRTSNNDALRI